MVMVFIILIMINIILVNGKIVKKMVLENLFGKIKDILDFIKMIKKMDLVFIFGLKLKKLLWDFGKKENKKVLGNL